MVEERDASLQIGPEFAVQRQQRSDDGVTHSLFYYQYAITIDL
jgi:hypothetical protein